MRIDGFLPNILSKRFAAVRNEARRCVLHMVLTGMRGRDSGRTARSRRWGACCGAATIFVASAPSSAFSQAISPLTPPALPPWNAETVFEPVPYARFWSRYPGEKIEPEDTPATRAYAFVDSLLGISSEVLNADPLRITAASRPAVARSQPMETILRCLRHQRARADTKDPFVGSVEEDASTFALDRRPRRRPAADSSISNSRSNSARDVQRTQYTRCPS